MSDPVSSEDLARKRFLALTMIRFTGVAVALLGVAILAGKVDLPAIAGFVLLAMGALDAMIMPLVLARRWKSPGQ
jgi:hypothetical protein